MLRPAPVHPEEAATIGQSPVVAGGALPLLEWPTCGGACGLAQVPSTLPALAGTPQQTPAIKEQLKPMRRAWICAAALCLALAAGVAQGEPAAAGCTDSLPLLLLLLQHVPKSLHQALSIEVRAGGSSSSGLDV